MGSQTQYRPEPFRPTGRCSGHRPGSGRTGSSSRPTRCSALRSCCQSSQRWSRKCRRSPVYCWRRPGRRPLSPLAAQRLRRRLRGRGSRGPGRDVRRLGGAPHRQCAVPAVHPSAPLRTQCEHAFHVNAPFLRSNVSGRCRTSRRPMHRGGANRVVRARSRRPAACAGPKTPEPSARNPGAASSMKARKMRTPGGAGATRSRHGGGRAVHRQAWAGRGAAGALVACRPAANASAEEAAANARSGPTKACPSARRSMRPRGGPARGCGMNR